MAFFVVRYNNTIFDFLNPHSWQQAINGIQKNLHLLACGTVDLSIKSTLSYLKSNGHYYSQQHKLTSQFEPR